MVLSRSRLTRLKIAGRTAAGIASPESGLALQSIYQCHEGNLALKAILEPEAPGIVAIHLVTGQRNKAVIKEIDALGYI